MLRSLPAIALAFLSTGFVRSQNFYDCGPEDRVIIIDQLEVPDTFYFGNKSNIFGGTINITDDSIDSSHLVVLHLIRVTPVMDIRVPCMRQYGSCERTIDDFMEGGELNQKCIFFKQVGISCDPKKAFKKAFYDIKELDIKVDSLDIPEIIKKLLEGDYLIRVMIKDPQDESIKGCLEMKTNLKL